MLQIPTTSTLELVTPASRSLNRNPLVSLYDRPRPQSTCRYLTLVPGYSLGRGERFDCCP